LRGSSWGSASPCRQRSLLWGVLVLFGAARAFPGRPETRCSLPGAAGAIGALHRVNSSVFMVAVIADRARAFFTRSVRGDLQRLHRGFLRRRLHGDAGGRRVAKIVQPMPAGWRASRRHPFRGSGPSSIGAISLDLSRCLLGGARRCCRVRARYPAVGRSFSACCAARRRGRGVDGFALATRPIERGTGWKMFAAVAVFGAATSSLDCRRTSSCRWARCSYSARPT